MPLRVGGAAPGAREIRVRTAEGPAGEARGVRDAGGGVAPSLVLDGGVVGHLQVGAVPVDACLEEVRRRAVRRRQQAVQPPRQHLDQGLTLVHCSVQRKYILWDTLDA